jgi:uracil-DNA glycosylase
MPTIRPLSALLKDIRACTICAASLPSGPRPVLQVEATARILIAGQAPGRIVHKTGIPFDDLSGDRLRGWMGVSRETFYDPAKIAILPMGFCFPGSGAAGDLPPRRECAPAWREPLMQALAGLELVLVIGAYAQAYHLPDAGGSVTAAVAGWRSHWPDTVPLPHPSPRNKRWLKQNPWFEAELLPKLQSRVAAVLK